MEKDSTSLQENWKDQGNISCKDMHRISKDRIGKNLTEEEDIKVKRRHRKTI